MKRVLGFTALTLLAAGAATAQAPMALLGNYNGTLLPVASAYTGAPLSQPQNIQAVGYNATGVQWGQYISGITATGSPGQTCLLTSFNNSSTATATVYLTQYDTIAVNSPLKITAAGSGATSAPTSATAGNGTAICSGAATILTGLGAFVPIAVDANGNLSGGGGSMTWPTGAAGIPNYNGSSAWGTSYNASNPIPNTFLPLTLQNLTLATTQAQADNSTKLATTAYVDTGLAGKQASGTYVTPTTLNNGTLPVSATTVAASAGVSGATGTFGSVSTTGAGADNYTAIADPGSPANGDDWYSSTTAYRRKFRGNTTTQTYAWLSDVPAAQVAADLSNSTSTGVKNNLPMAQVVGAAPSTSPVCPNGTANALTTVGCAAGGLPSAAINTVAVGPSDVPGGASATMTAVASPSPLYTVDPRKWVYLFDDFTGQVNTYDFGIYYWNNQCNVVTSVVVAGAYGVTQCATSGVSGNSAYFKGSSAANAPMLALNATTGDIIFRVALQQTATSSFFVGMSTANNPGEAASGFIGVAYDTNVSDTGWMCVGNSAGTKVRTAVAGTLDTAFHDLRIRLTNGGFSCSVDGGTETAISSTYTPTVALQAVLSLKAQAASIESFQTDYFYASIALAR